MTPVLRSLLIGLVLLTGCGGSSASPLDPSQYPLNPQNARESVEFTGNWANVISTVSADTGAVLTSVDPAQSLEPCATVAGNALTGAIITYNSCVSSAGDTYSGTVTVAAVQGEESSARYDLAVIAQDGTPYTITGTTTLALEDSALTFHQSGDLQVKEQLSKITLKTDLRYSVAKLTERTPYPTGSVTAKYQTLGLNLLNVTLAFDGNEVVAVDVNGAGFSYNLMTGMVS